MTVTRERLELLSRRAVVLGLAGAAVTILPLLNFSWSRPTVLLGSVFLLFSGVFLTVQLQLRTPEEVDVRVALTGGPAAGKTVLVNLIFDRLMRSGNPRIEVTANASTAIAVYQVIRSIDSTVWPARTGADNIYRYLAEIRFSRRPKDLLVDLELGDTAGEHWLELADRSSGSGKSDHQSYVEYVMASRALIHVVPCDRLNRLSDYPVLDDEVTDLIFLSQLRRGAKAGPRLSTLLFTLSKCDLWIDDLSEAEPIRAFLIASVARAQVLQVGDLARLLDSLHYRYRETHGPPVVTALGHVIEAANELAPHFDGVAVSFSSFSADKYRRTLVEPAEVADEVLRWIEDVSSPVRTRRSRKRERSVEARQAE